MFRNPAERVTELQKAYREPTADPEALRRIHDSQRRSYDRQLALLRRLAGASARGLEVGSYTGAFLAAARDAGLAFQGLDLNADANAFVARLGLRTTTGDLDTFASSGNFDVIAIWNTFDQLLDPRAALHAAKRLVRPNGLLAIRVPNGEFYARHRLAMRSGSPIRRSSATRKLALNNLLGFPYRWGFTLGGLRKLLRDMEFTVVQARGDVLPPLADEFTRRWAAFREAASKRILRRLYSGRPGSAPWFELYARST